MPNQPIYVTQPYLPPLQDFVPYLEQIWSRKTLTNNGPFHQQLEEALCRYLEIDHLALFANGTIALVTALQALRITGEVITTPYSFVATSHSLVWNNLEPVFVDIDPTTCNMDPSKIKAAITPRTTAILPVHCYGSPCDVKRIQKIADTYGLKVIYDAAHAFGVKLDGQNVLCHGDLSILSFHATKVFTTFEGGAIVCPDAKTKQRIDYLKNFGFADEVTVMAPGINGKMNEFGAALGLLQLEHIDHCVKLRNDIESQYRDGLGDTLGISLLPPPLSTKGNSSYFPIFVENNFPVSRDELYDLMREQEIYCRRYFYPLISDMPMYRGLPSSRPENLPNAQSAAREVLCLPIYPDLKPQDVVRIIDLIRTI